VLLKTIVRALFVGLGLFFWFWQPDAGWIEHAYANGSYPGWQHAAFAAANPLPWSLGDLAALLGFGLIAWRVAAFFRRKRGTPAIPALGLLLVDVAAILGVYLVWFEVSWGWNYSRAPIETRVVFDESRINARATDALRALAMKQANALAAPAHAEDQNPLDVEALRLTWLPAVQRAGDTWIPLTGEPKPTIFNPFMQATGTSGFINPLTLNVQLASDVLWFERPFALSHEWSHTAAYAREDEANYLAILTCVRSSDPAIRYSGWLETFLSLPPRRTRYRKREFAPLVWSDFAAMRARDARHINTLLANWSWHTYNAYLKSNRVASGVYNYSEVSRLLLGAPLGADGLPIAK
jgi:hypothetical protein